MKLCVNCRHYIAGLDRSSDRCNHLDNAITDPVRGTVIMGFCTTNRMPYMPCGSEGKHYTPNSYVEPGESEHV